MLTKYSRLKIRRKFRARKKVVKQSADDANKQLERHLFRRQHNWQVARRFIIGWVGLMVLLGFGVSLQIRGLGNTYLTIEPTSGGVYSEGIIGNLNNANPIYTSSSVDNAVSSLVFSSLFNYNKQNKLVGDLASGWKADDNAKNYTVTLKDNIYWHDGEKFDADDVVFTYNTIKNVDAQSNLYSTWRGIKVKKIDDLTVQFTLPNSYSPFPHLLTNGILPSHKLNDLEPSQLRSSEFNNNPIGTGPFKWRDVSVLGNVKQSKSEIIQLVKNDGYFKGDVQLAGFNIKTYPDRENLESALKSKDIDGAAGTSFYARDNEKIKTLLFNQTSQLFVFMNTQSTLLKDNAIRKALIKATNVKDVSKKLEYSTIPVDQPILKGQVGYNEKYKQIAANSAEVDKILSDAGWTWAEGDQYRKKDGKELSLNFITENTPEYAQFSEEIQNQWAKLGIKTNVVLEESANMNNILDSKEYDVLLYPINIGADSDVYAYWHSSQADDETGRNLSRYKSDEADASLEAARSRVDNTLRAAKYVPFLESWQKDIPAIGIHQPVFLYSTNVKVYNLEESSINSPADRYKQVHNWQIKTKKTTIQK